MDVTVNTEDLREVYDAAENDEVREALFEIVAEAEPPLTELYPRIGVGDVGDEDMEAPDEWMVDELEKIDADEIVAELEEDEDGRVGVDEAQDILNEQAPLEGVIKTTSRDGELYMYGPDISVSLFTTQH